MSVQRVSRCVAAKVAGGVHETAAAIASLLEIGVGQSEAIVTHVWAVTMVNGCDIRACMLLRAIWYIRPGRQVRRQGAPGAEK